MSENLTSGSNRAFDPDTSEDYLKLFNKIGGAMAQNTSAKIDKNLQYGNGAVFGNKLEYKA